MYKYAGNGWIHGVPARDLSDEEAKKYGIIDEIVSRPKK